MKKRVVIAGASGLIGRNLTHLLSGFDTHILVRSSVSGVSDDIDQHVAAPGSWPEIIASLRPDVAISCLGTTIKKSDNDEKLFRAVDHDLVLAFAASSHSSGAGQFIAVSSTGAALKSRNLYLRTKGEVEKALTDLAFDRLDIIRPGLLTGERINDLRPAEQAAMLFSPIIDRLIPDRFSRFRSISAQTVARAIAKLVGNRAYGKFIHENDAIHALAS